MTNLAEVCLVGLRVGGNYVRCLVVVVITMRFGGAKRCEGSLKSSFCVCVCVCVYVCMYVCIYVLMYAWMDGWMDG